MNAPTTTPLTLRLDDDTQVSALLDLPAAGARACYVFAHGAGAGMTHRFMAAMAGQLAQQGIATLRYQFPFMERGSKRPDPPELAHAAVRAAVAEARTRLAGVPLFAGGKSFGGRMTSQAQAEVPLEGVLGLVFVGFPLHPAGKASTERAAHLSKVACPMLFLQGTRDELAELPLIQAEVAKLGRRASMQVFADADHAFHVRARSGLTDDGTLASMVSAVVAWIDRTSQQAAAAGTR